MKAVILAGGKGTRLAPYTTVLPKPLMPVGGMPILEILIRQLKKHGVDDIVLCVGYLGSLLEAYFGSGERLGVRIRYSWEHEPMGTAGPIGLVEGLDEPFFAMNGDLLTTLDYSAMRRFHERHGRMATVGLADKNIKIDLGVIELGRTGGIANYVEKPQLNYKVSMGIYVFEPGIVSHIRGKGHLDLPDLVMALVRSGKEPMGYDSQCRWLDIGRIDDYSLASESFEKERSAYLP